MILLKLTLTLLPHKNEGRTAKRGRDYKNKTIKSCPENWVLSIDVDEFVYPINLKHNTIIDYISTISSNISQIKINWLNFGPCDYTWENGELLIEHLIKCNGNFNNIENRHTKPLIRKQNFKCLPSPHWAELTSGISTDAKFSSQNCDKTYPYLLKEHCSEGLLINHYRVRDLSFMDQKISWYKQWGHKSLTFPFIKEHYHQIIHTNIHRFLPQLKSNIKNG